ncbi:nitroreductase family deazaflavin-dependent oxidoreductase [Nocardia sp. XZ_19_385]|uniref:nitroreductase family deazaflavin-dependent oxidoreductase n=1 Tax=Nocardia sp. XZ_19_385 TaxID=2769488 RepID=UPI001E4F765D|nr:nitroreductase family deazaflavin-dependent oxidoreductase [Nocardia sp. XZ_19_385]
MMPSADGDGEIEAGQRSRPSLLARLAMSSSQFANKHGVYLGRRSTKWHVAGYRRSNGRIGGHLPGWPPARILLLDHIGAKSGIQRTSPLMYHDEGEFVAVVASKGGQPTHPAWFHNLKAHPDTTIQIGSEVRRVRARVATDAERHSLWLKCLAFYPGYEFFQRNAGSRKIPIVILEPRDADEIGR